MRPTPERPPSKNLAQLARPAENSRGGCVFRYRVRKSSQQQHLVFTAVSLPTSSPTIVGGFTASGLIRSERRHVRARRAVNLGNSLGLVLCEAQDTALTLRIADGRPSLQERDHVFIRWPLRGREERLHRHAKRVRDSVQKRIVRGRVIRHGAATLRLAGKFQDRIQNFVCQAGTGRSTTPSSQTVSVQRRPPALRQHKPHNV